MELIEKILADVLIKSVPDIHAAISSDLISDKSRKINETPKIRDWIRYYRNSKCIFEETLINLLSGIEINYESLINNFEDLIDRQIENTSKHDAFLIISDHRLQFFMRVITPCLLLYGQFPSIILRKARLGDENSIKKLARIDHSIIHDLRISQYILDLAFRNPTRHKLLIKSLTQDHPRPEIEEIKMSFAALISHFNNIFSDALNKKRMNYTQIRQLFVENAKLHDLEDDIDLPPGDDAFSRRIRRNKTWNELFKVPDKN